MQLYYVKYQEYNKEQDKFLDKRSNYQFKSLRDFYDFCDLWNVDVSQMKNIKLDV